MSRVAARIVQNLSEVRGRIADAAGRSGRLPDEITLVAVTKYAGVPEALALVEAGCLDLGESRPQELWHKAAAVPSRVVRWHLVGHLQRNKVARTLPLVVLVHSADSLRLIRAIDDTRGRSPGHSVPILLEVNISGDETKHGFSPGELEPLGEPLAALAYVDIRGLMCLAGREGGLDGARRNFALLRMLGERLREAWSGRWPLGELSMGMTSDYEVAVEEGATLVRVGSALFAGVGG